MPRYQSYAERAYRRVLERQDATAAELARAAAGLERIANKRAKKQASRPLVAAITKPAVELSPETLAELERRGLDGPPEQPCAVCGDKMAWRVFDDKVYCWRHVPGRPFARAPRPCAESGCGNSPSHEKAGKPYCWRHYPDPPKF